MTVNADVVDAQQITNVANSTYRGAITGINSGSSSNDTVLLVAAPRSDLRIAKTADPLLVQRGAATTTYTLTIVNDEPQAEPVAVVGDTRPAGTTSTPPPTSSQGACTVTGTTVECAPGALAVGATATVRITASSSRYWTTTATRR